MFADDTTLYESNNDLKKLISNFIVNIRPMLDWCKHNKLDINWSKTYFMFITNKRIKTNLPVEIEIIKDTVVKVVDNFKLLGVTIDNKLNFDLHCANTRKIPNRKMFSIKIQFFKTFMFIP